MGADAFRRFSPDPLDFLEDRLCWRCGRGLSTDVLLSDWMVSAEVELSEGVGAGGSMGRLASLARN